MSVLVRPDLDGSGRRLREPVRIPSRARPRRSAPTPFYAVRAGGLVFCSGQGARDPKTGREAGVELDAAGAVVRYEIAVQTRAALRNLRGVLEAAGTSWERLVEVNVFLKDMNDFAAMNDVYAREFPDGGPARTTIGVADLPGDNFVEIRAVALA